MSASRLIDAFKDGDKRLAQRLFDSNPSLYDWYKLTTFQSLLCDKPVGGVSLLHLAAYWGWEDFTERLVTSHGDAITDGEGNIPLHYAAYNGHLDLVRYFIAARDCDPIAENYHRSTPVHLACSNGQLNVVQYLTSETCCDPSCRDYYDDAPLHYACSNGHLDIVQYLISEAHCDPSCVGSHGDTPLHDACSWVTSTLSSILSVKHTVTHHVRTKPVEHHLTVLVLMVTSTLSSTSSVRHTATHQV